MRKRIKITSLILAIWGAILTITNIVLNHLILGLISCICYIGSLIIYRR